MTLPRLNRRLVLEASLRSPDGAGGYQTAWTPLGTLWAAFDPGTARLSGQPAGPESRQPLRITVRGAPIGTASRPTAGQRFRDGDRLYRIDSVAEADGRGRFLECLAREEAAL